VPLITIEFKLAASAFMAQKERNVARDKMVAPRIPNMALITRKLFGEEKSRALEKGKQQTQMIFASIYKG
jgi:hypothetical protein